MGNKLPTNKRYTAVLLVTLMIIINYIDRTNFSVATPSLMEEFGLGTGEMGILMSAFLWSYILLQIPIGVIINKFGPKWVIGISCAGWGLVTMLTGAANSFLTLLFLRILLGVTESSAYPTATRVVSVWVPAKERTFSTGLFDCGNKVGSAFAPPIVALIIVAWGWRMSFVVTGLIAVVYAVIFFVLYKEPDEHPTVSKEELAYIRQDEVLSAEGKVKSEPIPLLKLFKHKNFMIASLGNCINSYMLGTFLFWIPTYLVMTRGLDTKQMGFYAMIPYIVAIVCELSFGKLFDRLTAQGKSLSKLRRTGIIIGDLVCVMGIVGTIFATTAVGAVIGLSVFWGAFSVIGALSWSIPADLAPYGQAGGLTGVYNFIAQLGTATASIATGFIAQSRFGFNGAFAICIVCALICVILYAIGDFSRLEVKDGIITQKKDTPKTDLDPCL